MSIKLFVSLQLVPMKVLSGIASPLLSALLMNLSMLDFKQVINLIVCQSVAIGFDTSDNYFVLQLCY